MVSALKQVLWDASVLAEFGPSVDVSPYGQETPMQALGGCWAYEYQHDGQRVLIAVRPVPQGQGVRLDLCGLVSTGRRFVAGELDRVLAQIATEHRASSFVMSTMRPHLVKACLRHGWKKTGVIMQKEVSRHEQ